MLSKPKLKSRFGRSDLEMTFDMLSDIVSSIMESADEVKEKTNPDAQDYGRLLAYAEVLSIIRDSCDSDDLKEIGLDFDIDARYLYGN